MINIIITSYLKLLNLYAIFITNIQKKSFPQFGNPIQDSANPIYTRNKVIETSTFFLLHCPKYLMKDQLN